MSKNLFPTSFRKASERFELLAEQQSWKLGKYHLSPSATGGDELCISTARSSISDPRGALLISSGLHGVEGFVGSAIQSALMQGDLKDRAAQSGIQLVFVHVLNPFGMVHIRRGDANNIDLNRNGLPNAYQGAPKLYATLNSQLNPTRPPRRADRLTFKATAATIMTRYGRTRVSQAIACGQYEYPKGLFFGGTCLSENLAHFRDIIGSLSGVPHILHLDFHSGLGRWGSLNLLADRPPSGEVANRLAQVREKYRIIQTGSAQFPHRSTGTIGDFCQATLENSQYVHFCVELGTYSPLRVFSALRLENMAYHFGDVIDRHRWARSQLMEAFCPQSLAWRQNCIKLGVDCARRGLMFFDD